MTKRSQEDMLLYRTPLSETSQTKIYTLIEKCIISQRRLENAYQYLNDKNYNEATTMVDDTRSYRRVLVGDLIKTYENATVLENIRICEKAMSLMGPRVDNMCMLAGTENIDSN